MQIQRRSLLLGCLLILLSFPAVAQSLGDRANNAVESRVESILSKMTLEEKIDFIGGENNFDIRPLTRLGLPTLRMSDGPLGVHDYGPTTAYPATISLAASWDMDLAQRTGAIMGLDARARGVHFILAPGMNITRAPMGGRNFEYFGEDPYLASRMAVGMIEGIQSRGVIATAKHFAGNNQEYDRFNVSSDIDERILREIYLPAFEASVREAHVGAVMDAYNLVNGIHMTQHDYLNNHVLKGEWGFDGVLMSDWDSTHDGVAAALGGLDLEMPSGRFMNREALLPAIKDGRIKESVIDDKVRRILRKAIQFGLYDRPQADLDMPLYSKAGRELALESARAGIVLLKNDGDLLPLDRKKIKTLAVIGPNAYPAVIGGGGSSLTTPFRATSLLEGFADYLTNDVRVLYASDTPALDKIFKASEFVTKPGGPAGLKAEYFDNEEVKGPAALARIDQHLNFDWAEGGYAPGHPAYHFSVVWTGYFIPTETNDYRFYTSADDGVRLYLNDQKVIDDWQRHVETVRSYSVHLEAHKPYKIRLEYFQGTGGATLRFGVMNMREAITPELLAMARKADAVILCTGFDSETEGEGFDRSFILPKAQNSLIEQIAAVNPKTIVVLNSGGNVDMRSWLDRVPALLHAWYPGQEGATALAQIVFGEYSPSGKLPISFEQRWEDNPVHDSYYPAAGTKHVSYNEGVFVGYRNYDRAKVKPRFAFGFGLSYSTFDFSGLSATRESSDKGEFIRVSFTLKNTGARDGADVAQLYVGEVSPVVPRPLKELKGFIKVDLKPGESRPMSLLLDRRSFAYYDVNAKGWKVQPGRYSLCLGDSSQSCSLQQELVLTEADVHGLADPYAAH